MLSQKTFDKINEIIRDKIKIRRTILFKILKGISTIISIIAFFLLDIQDFIIFFILLTTPIMCLDSHLNYMKKELSNINIGDELLSLKEDLTQEEYEEIYFFLKENNLIHKSVADFFKCYEEKTNHK